MADARRMNRHEEVQNGEIVWLSTGVEMGHDGFKNLKHFDPIAQGIWQHFNQSTHHALSYVFDTTTSRIMARITANETGAKTSQIRIRVLLPKDFGSFPSSALKVVTRKSADVVAYTITMLKGGTADSTINGSSIEPSVNNTFETFSLTPGSTYAAGDWVTFSVELQTNTIGHWAEIGDFELTYVTARGNV